MCKSITFVAFHIYVVYSVNVHCMTMLTFRPTLWKLMYIFAYNIILRWSFYIADSLYINSVCSKIFWHQNEFIVIKKTGFFFFLAHQTDIIKSFCYCKKNFFFFIMTANSVIPSMNESVICLRIQQDQGAWENQCLDKQGPDTQKMGLRAYVVNKGSS